MKTALIGYTGFVGGNLYNQHVFDDVYNSKNITDIRGKEYDLVVCAGVRAEKWRINQEPEKDLNEVKSLLENLRLSHTKKLVLISTVDVYKTPIDVYEDTPIDIEGLHAYGKNRYFLEEECIKNFDTLVVRLPGLFGNGLKKNVIFDFLNDNNIENINSESSLQYYNLENIWKDINIALDAGLKIINFSTEPIKTSELVKYCFGIDFNNEPEGVLPVQYDMRSRHSELYNSRQNYLYNKSEVLKMIKLFVENYQGPKIK